MFDGNNYSDVRMGMMASQLTSLTIVYSTVYSDADQRTHQSSASLAFVRGIHRWPVNSPHKSPVTRKMFPFDSNPCWNVLGSCPVRLHWSYLLLLIGLSIPILALWNEIPQIIYYIYITITQWEVPSFPVGWSFFLLADTWIPDSKAYGANMGPTWGRHLGCIYWCQ